MIGYRDHIRKLSRRPNNPEYITAGVLFEEREILSTGTKWVNINENATDSPYLLGIVIASRKEVTPISLGFEVGTCSRFAYERLYGNWGQRVLWHKERQPFESGNWPPKNASNRNFHSGYYRKSCQGKRSYGILQETSGEQELATHSPNTRLLAY